MQQFYSVIQYNAITLRVLLKEYIFTNCSLWCIQQFPSVILIKRVNYNLSIMQGDKIH
jgi:hypothetical protein